MSCLAGPMVILMCWRGGAIRRITRALDAGTLYAGIERAMRASAAAWNSGANGSATITGAGSTLGIGGRLFVGFAGVGTMNIASGGVVTSSDGSVSGLPSANGSGVTVIGTGSRWTLTGDLGFTSDGHLSASSASRT